MSAETIRTSRRELFDQVWSAGFVKAAARYNLTDDALRKLCARYHIPVPARDYFQRINAERTGSPVALPTLDGDPDIAIQIAPASSGTGAQFALFKPAIEAETAFPPIVVSRDLVHPHLTTIALGQALGGKPDRDGMVQNIGADAFLVRVHTASVSRVLCLADALAKACSARGFEFLPGSQGTRHGSQLRVVVEGVAVAIVINERSLLAPYRPTAAEMARQRAGLFVPIPINRLVPTGELALKLHPYWGTRLQGVWADTRTRPVEQRLDEVMLGLRRLAIWRRAEPATDGPARQTPA